MWFAARIRTLLNLGLLNVLRVLKHRALVKCGWYALFNTRLEFLEGDFFVHCSDRAALDPAITNIPQSPKLFGYLPLSTEPTPPDWHLNVLSGVAGDQRQDHWWAIHEFSEGTGDVKGIWEMSRFDWALFFAQLYRAGADDSLEILNAWLNHWCIHNAPNKGYNWRCGQEAAIRVMRVALVAIILKQHLSPTAPLVRFLLVHLQRIKSTLGYALGQNNNHGTSEAAALFIGGIWLSNAGVTDGDRFRRLGYVTLENRARELILDDGTFSQYSVNYHRLMLDTFSVAEIWRRNMGGDEFSPELYKKLLNATDWLAAMIMGHSGETPNIGHNDSSNLLPLIAADNRDMRPSVHLATSLFSDSPAFPDDGNCQALLSWLRVSSPEGKPRRPKVLTGSKGGFATFQKGNFSGVVKIPRTQFRPGQADMLHLDLWFQGVNLLRDGGTYSYNAEHAIMNYFSGVESHNTAQFDRREPMRRISRFLFADWLNATSAQTGELEDGVFEARIKYSDREGATHSRAITATSSAVVVVDQLSGFRDCGVLRWRLAPDNWQIEGNEIFNSKIRIKISTTPDIHSIELLEGWESLYYSMKTPLPVIEITLPEAAEVRTEFRSVN